jgi:Family of unknown function (DUF6064)
MRLPFTIEEFFGVFRAYNEALWPAPVLLTALALVATALALIPLRWSGVAIAASLAFLWGWLAIAYHLSFFTAINPLAYGFSVLSLVGAAVFLWQGVVRRRLIFRATQGGRTVVGMLLVVFALVVYPVWSTVAGHPYPAMPTFGLPCPTTIFTIGLLALAVAPYPRAILVVPILWALVGTQAAFLLGVPQDLSLGIAGLIGMALLVRSGGAPTPADSRRTSACE